MIKCQKCSEENKPEEGNSVEYYLTELLTDKKKKNKARQKYLKQRIQTEIYTTQTNLLNCHIVSILPNKASKTSLDNSRSEFCFK